MDAMVAQKYGQNCNKEKRTRPGRYNPLLATAKIILLVALLVSFILVSRQHLSIIFKVGSLKLVIHVAGSGGRMRNAFASLLITV